MEFFKSITDVEETLRRLKNYSPGENSLLEDFSLRKDVEEVILSYDKLNRKIKKKFSREEIMFQYDLLHMNVPLID
jgi:hypothetical protein